MHLIGMVDLSQREGDKASLVVGVVAICLYQRGI